MVTSVGVCSALSLASAQRPPSESQRDCPPAHCSPFGFPTCPRLFCVEDSAIELCAVHRQELGSELERPGFKSCIFRVLLRDFGELVKVMSLRGLFCPQPGWPLGSAYDSDNFVPTHWPLIS